MDRPKWQRDIDEHLHERARAGKLFFWFGAVPIALALAVGAWLGWFPGM